MSIIVVGRARTSGAACAIRATAGPRIMASVCLAAAATVLSGCGGGSATPAVDVVTVTITPTVTATAARPIATATPTATRVGPVKSDVVGRRFDLGTIVAVRNDGGVPVIILDRWTARAEKDATLAKQGIQIHVHSDAPYQNLNHNVTYRVPVAQGATFTYRHCVAIDQPAVQRSSTLAKFTRLHAPENLVLLRLDLQGQVVAAQNDPAC